jgi:hypothetical protein
MNGLYRGTAQSIARLVSRTFDTLPSQVAQEYRHRVATPGHNVRNFDKFSITKIAMNLKKIHTGLLDEKLSEILTIQLPS